MTISQQLIFLRTRAEAGPPDTAAIRATVWDWKPAHTAVVICDMWDAHHCITAARRTAAMAPRVNVVAGALRAMGALIIHAPAGCMGFGNSFASVSVRFSVATSLMPFTATRAGMPGERRRSSHTSSNGGVHLSPAISL